MHLIHLVCCREEITRLMEVLNSRVDKEDEQKSRSNAEGDAQMVPWMPEVLKTPSEGEKQCNERAMIGYYSEKSKVSAYFCVCLSFRTVSLFYYSQTP